MLNDNEENWTGKRRDDQQCERIGIRNDEVVGVRDEAFRRYYTIGNEKKNRIEHKWSEP